MTTTRLTTPLRLCALALAVLLPAASVAAAEQPRLAPVRQFTPLIGPEAPWNERPSRRAPARPRFPVAGRFEFGESQARFGASRSGRSHAGQDVFADPGTPVVAVRDGVVLESGADGGGRGNYVAIFSPAARQTYVYLHLISAPRVRRGQRVAAGRRLGGVGCSGSCSGDHLHFEVRVGRGLDAKPLDPLPIIRRWRRR